MMHSFVSLKVGACLIALALPALAPTPTTASSADCDSPRKVSVDDYARAEQMLSKNIVPKLLNTAIDPIWLPDGNRFWYRRQTVPGGQYLAVDPRRGTRQPAFDADALTQAVSAVVGQALDANNLTLGDLEFIDSSGRGIAFSTGGFVLECDLAHYTCKGSRAVTADPHVVVSPNRQLAVFTRENNLWLRTLSTGGERQLTRDGSPHFAYGKMPDVGLLSVVSQSKGLRWPPYGVDWAPDSRHIVVTRVDESKEEPYHFLQFVPYDGDRRPRLITIRAPLAGEPPPPVEVSIIDIDTGVTRPVAAGTLGLSTEHYWDPNGSRFLALQGGLFGREEALYEVMVASGNTRKVLQESSGTFLQSSPLVYDEAAVRFIPSRNEMIWFSQRDGWDHLYRLNIATGKIESAITHGDYDIQNIIRVDAKAGNIYFTAVGREAGENPYWRHLYVTDLHGVHIKNLTPKPADHSFPARMNPALALALQAVGISVSTPELISPSGRFMIDTYSTPQEPPVSVLKRIDGSSVMQLETADASSVNASGWITPEPFTVKAADGKTNLYGLILHPAHFNPACRYPIIDAIYNGPQVVTTPHDFMGGINGIFASDAQTFAQLGFAVIVMDGRGTPLRSKAFQDYIYNNMNFGLPDHVAAIKQLAAAHAYLDIDRVGVYGHSFGGFASMEAILRYGDLFKVAASSAGPYDLYAQYPFDSFFAPPQYANGTGQPGGPTDYPTNWGDFDLTRDAGRLQGKLLLGYAGLDENAYPAEAGRMINALTTANKSFDLIYMPNDSHAFSGDPYFIRRRWDFFVSNLLGATPPDNYGMPTFQRKHE
jgi:dipeptidyl aminopeptidase/acylaminoacyl peptidase